MAVSRLSGILPLLAALCSLTGRSSVEACSVPVGWQPPTDVEKVLGADQVLYVGMRAKYYVGGFVDTMYTAGVEVYCNMKGRQSAQRVNMSNVGYAPGLCVSTDMEIGRDYIVLASYSENNDKYYPYERIPATPDKLSEVAMACGLQKVYPFGVDESTASNTCPEPAEPGTCIEYVESQIVGPEGPPGPPLGPTRRRVPSRPHASRRRWKN